MTSRARRDPGHPRRDPGRLRKEVRPGDLLVVLAAVALAVALWTASSLTAVRAGGAAVVHDGTVLRTFSAADLAKDATYSFESEGYHYTVRTGGGAIRFEAADCPDKVCVRTGWISHAPQVSACVPGHLLLRVLGDAGDVDVMNR